MKFSWSQIILCFSLFNHAVYTTICSQDSLPPSLKRFIADEQGFQAHQVPKWRNIPNLTTWQTAYSPHLKPTFPITGCWIALENFKGMGGAVVGDDEKLRQQFSRRSSEHGEEILFFTHPEESTQKEYLNNTYNPDDFSCEEYCATPTSSNRTLLVWKPIPSEKEFSPVFIKLSISSANGIKNKTITNEEVHRSISVNKILTAQQSRQESFKKTFNFFKEPFAMTFKPEQAHGDFAKGAGFIVREIPSELLDPAKHIVSAFTLYGSPTTDDGSEPYLLKVFQHSLPEFYETIRQKIIQPFVSQWLTAILEWDFVTEAHGQNLLVELDSDNNLTGILWHRDLDGFEVNNRLRQLRGLPFSKQDFTLTPKKILDSIYYSFNLFLSQMELSIAEWKKKYAVESAPVESLEFMFYSELMKQAVEIAQSRYGFQFTEVTTLKNKNRDYIRNQFSLYSSYLVSELAKMFALDEFIKLNSSLPNEESDILGGTGIDFHGLYCLGFRFDEAIKRLETQLNDGSRNQYQESLLQDRIEKMKRATDDEGLVRY